jgi:hypothetical protein
LLRLHQRAELVPEQRENRTQDMSRGQLRLVQDAPRPFNGDTTDPVSQVFEHWVFMLGKRVGSTVFGPMRRRAVAGALALGYSVEQLQLAVEGAAAEDLSWMRSDSARAQRRDLPAIMADETVIEAYMEQGEALRERLAAIDRRMSAAAPERVESASAEDVAQAERARERLRTLATRARDGRHG